MAGAGFFTLLDDIASLLDDIAGTPSRSAGVICSPYSGSVL
jgi:predicted DNA repair protein MutK